MTSRRAKKNSETESFRFLGFSWEIPVGFRLEQIVISNALTGGNAWIWRNNRILIRGESAGNFTLSQLEDTLKDRLQVLFPGSHINYDSSLPSARESDLLFYSGECGIEEYFVGAVRLTFRRKSPLEALLEGTKNPHARRNSGDAPFRFLGFSMDVPASYGLEEIIIPSAITGEGKWTWREGQILQGETYIETIQLDRLQKIILKKIQEWYYLIPPDLGYRADRSSLPDPHRIMFVGRIMMKTPGSSGESYLGTLLFVFRKKSPLEALLGGIENPHPRARKNTEDPMNWIGEVGVCPLVPSNFMVQHYSMATRTSRSLTTESFSSKNWDETKQALVEIKKKIPPHPISGNVNSLSAALVDERAAPGIGENGRLFKFELRYWGTSSSGKIQTLHCGVLFISGKYISSLGALLSGFENADSSS